MLYVFSGYFLSLLHPSLVCAPSLESAQFTSSSSTCCHSLTEGLVKQVLESKIHLGYRNWLIALSGEMPLDGLITAFDGISPLGYS